ncbi:PorP/SprF family type IX secretion system membrane protein [Pedobacter sp. Leaf170]|uniref:PorP/SprF family type IX secretion system membrane protein n=1 Tax=Pedobacter sp. Leaf170 TaxID=2876558 RepID=UPI001E5676B8|nr:PorP/SprF family type IX secretion system membrane protein [Pedobacter sp. Leaf170]
MCKIIITLFLCFITVYSSAQDPRFSQYFAAPLALNPAFTGYFDGIYRVALNTRRQWGNLGDPYNTHSISGDLKLIADENFADSYFSVGLSGLFDESFNKALKSQYLSASFSYYQYLDVNHRFKFGLAPQVSHVSRYLDQTKLTFATQFTGYDFDTSMPNYLDLENDRISYFDVSIGVNFSAQFESFSVVGGYAHYHLTEPNESFLGANKTPLKARRNINFGLLYPINNYVDLNLSAIYNFQGTVNDRIVGAVVGIQPNEDSKIKINAGLWHNINESSFYPYLGLVYGNLSAGLNYTLHANKIINTLPRTYEISLIYRHNNFKGFKVPCPRF